MKAPTTQVSETQLVEEIMQAIDVIDRNGLVDLANTLLSELILLLKMLSGENNFDTPHSS